MTPVERRFQHTLQFLEAAVTPPTRILDLGVDNEFARRMRGGGFEVFNTPAVDLDLMPEVVDDFDVDVVTAFEILEHLVSPLGVLSRLRAQRLIATVPTRLWFAKAYRNASDPFDQHYHEFEPWQFDMLLEKAGWKIVRRERWKSPGGIGGVRPLLRRVTPRYYAVEAVREAVQKEAE